MKTEEVVKIVNLPENHPFFDQVGYIGGFSDQSRHFAFIVLWNPVTINGEKF